MKPEDLARLRGGLKRAKRSLEENREREIAKFKSVPIKEHIMAFEAAKELRREYFELQEAYTAGPQTKKKKAEHHLKAIVGLIDHFEQSEPSLGFVEVVSLANAEYGKIMQITKSGSPFYRDEKRLRRLVRDFRKRSDVASNSD